ncbi:MAG TPA: Nif11-like leader peptide family natural product precursor [Gemmatimonadaceae bacterium]|nr:Nif11-like leader peptide family natural product precursor [Gemmatimonadaceae bacterium]
MSTARALAFIRAARHDENLRRRIAALPPGTGIEGLGAARDGYEFSNDELEEAFRIDWTARWVHYRGQHGADARE